MANNDLNNPPTKMGMLESIRKTRGDLERLLSGLSPEEMSEHGVQEAWSIKDILAHIAAWERLTLDRLDSAFSGRPPSRRPIRSERDVDEMNAQVYAANQNRPLGEVLAEYESAHRDILALIGHLDEKEFASPIPAGWAHGKPVWEMIGENTCWHYAEHSEAIEEWLSRR